MHTNTFTNTYTHHFLLVMALDFVYQWIYTILPNHIHQVHVGQKSSLSVDTRNFNKTKSLRGNQFLDENSSNSKKQKTTSIKSRTEKIIFRNVWP